MGHRKGCLCAQLESVLELRISLYRSHHVDDLGDLVIGFDEICSRGGTNMFFIASDIFVKNLALRIALRVESVSIFMNRVR